MLSLPSEPLYFEICTDFETFGSLDQYSQKKYDEFFVHLYLVHVKKVVLRNIEESLTNMELALGIAIFYSVFWGGTKIEGPLCAPPSNLSYRDNMVIV